MLRRALLPTLVAAAVALAGDGIAAQGLDGQTVDQAAIDAAIDHGTKYLHAEYGERLKRGELDEEVGLTALALYTLLKCGVPADDDVVRGLLAHVQFQRIDHTYDATCALLAAQTHDAIANRRWIAALAQRLVDWQKERGDWSYPQGDGDLSNTQYAALGLWAASRAGVRIDTYVWEKLATTVLRYQDTDGGFTYRCGEGHSTGSMTAAGVGVLAICELELRQWYAWLDPLASSVRDARERGVAWLQDHFSVKTNPPERGLWLFYYLYGLERLGALAGLARIGDHDWYAEGAAVLVARQNPEGAWRDATHPADTCFALLFLRRATAGRRGPITGIDDSEVASHPLRLGVAGDGPTRVWVEGWTPSLIREFEWPGEKGQGPHVVCVEYLADDLPVAVALGDPTRPAGSARFAAEHVFTGKGTHRLRARAIVRIPGEPPREAVLESSTIALDVARVLPDWVAEERLKLGPDLLSPDTATARASSEAHGKSAPFGRTFSAELALDGETQTPWLADGEDERRTLTISLRRAVEADLLRVAPALLTPLGTDGLARPVEIEVEINGEDVHRLAMDPDPSHALSIELDPPVAVKSLVLRIRSVARSPTGKLVGIGEVDLFRRRK